MTLKIGATYKSKLGHMASPTLMKVVGEIEQRPDDINDDRVLVQDLEGWFDAELKENEPEDFFGRDLGYIYNLADWTFEEASLTNLLEGYVKTLLEDTIGAEELEGSWNKKDVLKFLQEEGVRWLVIGYCFGKGHTREELNAAFPTPSSLPELAEKWDFT